MNGVASDCSVIRNLASSGSGIHSLSPGLLVQDSLIERNGAVFFGGSGGGISGSDGTLINCEISMNVAQLGAGVSGSFLLQNCLISWNSGDESDVGPAVLGSSRLEGCEIVGHRSYQSTAGCIVNAELVDCYVHGNSCDSSPAFSNRVGVASGCQIDGCLFVDNRAFNGSPPGNPSEGGAAVSCDIESSVFIDNRADLGAALAGCTAVNCQFWSNESVVGGVAVDSDLQNCTIIGSSALGSHAALVRCDADSCLIWNNGADAIDFDSTVVYSNTELLVSGLGNISLPPRLWSEVSGDFHLTSLSPCIDAGNPFRFDPDGSVTDIGALPFDPNYSIAPVEYCQGKQTSEGCIARLSSPQHGSLSGTPLLLRATALPQSTFGIVFLARALTEVPYRGGTLSIAGAATRGPLVFANNSGACGAVIDFVLESSLLMGGGYQVGEALFVQTFFRDQGHPDGTGFGITNGVQSIVMP
jgi:hypothetical protein